jgi:hydroxymethylpyrimidine/phosphomethylpyrimidine kinase
MLRQQIEAVFEELNPAAVKTGMLFAAENIRVIVDFLAGQGCRQAGSRGRSPRQNRRPPLVVDPLMVSTSGAKLLEPAARKILAEELLPLAALVMPNLDEAEILSGQTISSIEAMRAAAREIHSRFGCAVLAKGGHLKNSAEAVDIFFDGETELLLSAPFVKGIRTHGTGCAYSAAICAALALGHDLPHAVELGKKFITSAIANSYRVGSHFALGNFPLKDPASSTGRTGSHSSRSAKCNCCHSR